MAFIGMVATKIVSCFAVSWFHAIVVDSFMEQVDIDAATQGFSFVDD
jgi:hypothetical protein